MSGEGGGEATRPPGVARRPPRASRGGRAPGKNRRQRPLFRPVGQAVLQQDDARIARQLLAEHLHRGQALQPHLGRQVHSGDGALPQRTQDAELRTQLGSQHVHGHVGLPCRHRISGKRFPARGRWLDHEGAGPECVEVYPQGELAAMRMSRWYPAQAPVWLDLRDSWRARWSGFREGRRSRAPVVRPSWRSGESGETLRQLLKRARKSPSPANRPPGSHKRARPL